jgi:hypothetical protein
MASMSSGTSVRRSSTAAEMPCSSDNTAAALRATSTWALQAMRVTSSPVRIMFALPSGTRCSPSGTSSFTRR